jgi:hypothetical protein
MQPNIITTKPPTNAAKQAPPRPRHLNKFPKIVLVTGQIPIIESASLESRIVMKSPSIHALAWLAAIAMPTVASAEIPSSTQGGFLGLGHQLPAAENYQDVKQSSAYTPFSPSDSDLGVQEILSPYSGRSPVVVDFSTAFYRTDNAPSANAATDEPAWMWLCRGSVAWRPRIAGGWFGDFALYQDIVRFDNSSAFDYENTGVTIGVVKFIPQLDDLLVFGRYEYQRVTSGSLSDSDYWAQRIRLGAQKTVFASPRHELTLGTDVAFDFTAKPNNLERNEYALSTSYRYFFADNLYSLATWRLSRFDFDGDRHDWTNAVSLELIWQFTKDARASLSVFYGDNDSNTFSDLNDYAAWTGGIGAGVSFLF